MNVSVKRQNNYVLLRLLLALSILLTHSYDLWNTPNLEFINSFFRVRVSVDSFFIISGFFIFSSYERSSSAGIFFKKRIIRIYPAYTVVIILMMLLGVVLTQGLLLQHPGTLARYFISNFSSLNFLQLDLPGVFTENHHTSVNSSLWTLKVELMFYLSIPILFFVMNRLGRNRTLILIYIFSVIYAMTLNHLYVSSGEHLYYTLARQIPGKLCMFASGAFLSYHKEFFKKHSIVFLVLGIMGVVTWWFLNFYPVYPISLAALLIFFGSCFKYLGNVGKFGDLSVGIFMYHCPVMQTLIGSGKFSDNPMLGLFTGALIVLLMAYASWHLVEKRFLRVS